MKSRAMASVFIREVVSHSLRAVACAATMALVACHADVTYRLDVHPDQSVTTTIREVFDDQFYSMAADRGNDPFGVDSAKQNGWDVERTTDDDENHVIKLTRTVAVKNFASNADNDTSPLSKMSALSIPLPTVERGLFTDTAKVDVTIPPLNGSLSTTDSSYAFASAGAAMAASIISFHVIAKVPGKVLDTNGETLPDGATRWNISFTSPTTLHYVVEVPDVEHIAIAVAGIVAVLGIVFVAIRRRRRAWLLESPLEG